MSPVASFFQRFCNCSRVTCPRVRCPRIECTQEFVSHLLTGVVAFVALVGVGLSSAEVILKYRDCVKGVTTPDTECGEHFRPAVWALILELVVLVVTMACMVTGLVEKAHHAVVGFLVLGAAGMINFSEKALLGEANIEDDKARKVAAAGFIILAVVNVGLILSLGVQRVKGSSSGLRPVREYTPHRFSLVLFVTFGVCIGAFMVGASVLSARKECEHEKEPDACLDDLDMGLKWWVIAFVLAVMLAIGVGEAVGILENFGTTLAALVALAAITAMDAADRALVDANKLSEELEAGGFIILSVISLLVVLVLGLVSVGKPESNAQGDSRLLSCTTVPLLFGTGLTIAGVALFNQNCKGECMGSKFHFMYWTIAFELASVILCVLKQKLSLEKLRVPSILFIVLATVSQMVEVEKLMEIGDKKLGIAAGGFMVTSAMNMVLVGLLGFEGDAADLGAFTKLEV